MTMTTMPQGRQRYYDNDGNLAVGCLLYTYAAGTSTPKAAYTDAAGLVPHQNPIELDAKGEAFIYWSGAYKVDLKTAGGVQVTGWPVDNISAPFIPADLSPSAGAGLIGFSAVASYAAGTVGRWMTDAATGVGSAGIGFIQAGVGALLRTMQAKSRDIVNAKDYGATPVSSNAANKVALQEAITEANLTGVTTITADYDTCYGRKTTTPATWPSFSGITRPIIIQDHSRGDTQEPDVYPTRYDGAQLVTWLFTPQTTSPGQHDGNTIWLRAAWAPAYCLSNDMNLPAVGDPSRLATDNLRANYATMVNGVASTQIGQGTRAGAGLTVEELSNGNWQKFALPGDTLGDYNPLVWERKTGNWSIMGGRNIPAAHCHIEATTGSPTLNTLMLESKGTTCAMTMRNSTGAADDVELRNVAGDIALHITGVGNALVALKANRYIGIGTNTPTYPLHVTKAVASDYVAFFENTSATNGYGPKITSSTAAGIGFDLLQMYTSGADIKFRFRGDGAGTCDGAWTGGGADRAEAMEWADGNPGGVDGDKLAVGSTRAGCTVSMVGGKIKIAAPGDVVIGVVSMTYDSLGNAAPLNWGKKYLRDDFGVLEFEQYEVIEWVERIHVKDAIDGIEPFTTIVKVKNKDGTFRDAEFLDPGREAVPARYEEIKHSYPADAIPAGVVVPDDAKRIPMKRQRLNPDFDPVQPYVPRIERKEWDPIGVLGICRVRKGQVMGANWIKMSDISPTVEEWLVR